MQAKEKYEQEMRMAKCTVQLLIACCDDAYDDTLFESLEYLFSAYNDAKRSLLSYKKEYRTQE